MKLKFFNRLVCTCALLILSHLSFAVSLNNVVVFGDSLSDTGNLLKKYGIPQEPYYKGRFSNGPVWVEQFVNVYYGEQGENHLKDFAYGGAGIEEDGDEVPVLTLKHQVDEFLPLPSDMVDPNNLYVVWIGANNYFILDNDSSTDDVEKLAQSVTHGIDKQLRRLADKGAKHILVINIPDLGRTPSAREANRESIWAQASLRHNELLETRVAQLQTDFPEVQWVQFDTKTMLDKVINSPELYGFANVNAPCIDLQEDKELQTDPLAIALATNKPKAMSLLKKAGACDAHLFFDSVHCTVAGHEAIALEVLRQLESEGIVLGDGVTNLSAYKYTHKLW